MTKNEETKPPVIKLAGTYGKYAGIETMREAKQALHAKDAEIAEANALLIAAAPEILSVCNAGVHDVQRVLDNWASGDLAAAVNGLEAWQETARAAIAKAEGGAS